jgi:hypothetical protein
VGGGEGANQRDQYAEKPESVKQYRSLLELSECAPVRSILSSQVYSLPDRKKLRCLRLGGGVTFRPERANQLL